MRFKDIKGVAQGNLFYVNLDLLKHLPGFNIREKLDMDHVRQIADVMKLGKRQYEQVTPITVFKDTDDTIYVIDGWHRERAARLAQSEGATWANRMSCIPFTGSKDEAILYMLGSSKGRPHSPLEKAKAYKRLMDEYGYTVERLAQVQAVSQTHVQDMLRLLETPEEVQVAIREGIVSATGVIEAMNKVGTHEVGEAVKRAKKSVEGTDKEGNRIATTRALKGAVAQMRLSSAEGMQKKLGPITGADWLSIALAVRGDAVASEAMERLLKEYGCSLDEILAAEAVLHKKDEAEVGKQIEMVLAA
jgi:ParB family chromosome partitioning protein